MVGLGRQEALEEPGRAGLLPEIHRHSHSPQLEFLFTFDSFLKTPTSGMQMCGYFDVVLECLLLLRGRKAGLALFVLPLESSIMWLA